MHVKLLSTNSTRILLAISMILATTVTMSSQIVWKKFNLTPLANQTARVALQTAHNPIIAGDGGMFGIVSPNGLTKYIQLPTKDTIVALLHAKQDSVDFITSTGNVGRISVSGEGAYLHSVLPGFKKLVTIHDTACVFVNSITNEPQVYNSKSMTFYSLFSFQLDFTTQITIVLPMQDSYTLFLADSTFIQIDISGTIVQKFPSKLFPENIRCISGNDAIVSTSGSTIRTSDGGDSWGKEEGLLVESDTYLKSFNTSDCRFLNNQLIGVISFTYYSGAVNKNIEVSALYSFTFGKIITCFQNMYGLHYVLANNSKSDTTYIFGLNNSLGSYSWNDSTYSTINVFQFDQNSFKLQQNSLSEDEIVFSVNSFARYGDSVATYIGHYSIQSERTFLEKVSSHSCKPIRGLRLLNKIQHNTFLMQSVEDPSILTVLSGMNSQRCLTQTYTGATFARVMTGQQIFSLGNDFNVSTDYGITWKQLSNTPLCPSSAWKFGDSTWILIAVDRSAHLTSVFKTTNAGIDWKESTMKGRYMRYLAINSNEVLIDSDSSSAVLNLSTGIVSSISGSLVPPSQFYCRLAAGFTIGNSIVLPVRQYNSKAFLFKFSNNNWETTLLDSTTILPSTFDVSFWLSHRNKAYTNNANMLIEASISDTTSVEDYQSSTDIHSAPFSVYPNPFENRLTISTEQHDTFSLLNLTGQVLQNLVPGDNMISTLPHGIYIIRSNSTGRIMMLSHI